MSCGLTARTCYNKFPNATNWLYCGIRRLTSLDGSINIDTNNPEIPDISLNPSGPHFMVHSDDTLTGNGTPESPLGASGIVARVYDVPANPVPFRDVVNAYGELTRATLIFTGDPTVGDTRLGPCYITLSTDRDGTAFAGEIIVGFGLDAKPEFSIRYPDGSKTHLIGANGQWIYPSWRFPNDQKFVITGWSGYSPDSAPAQCTTIALNQQVDCQWLYNNPPIWYSPASVVSNGEIWDFRYEAVVASIPNGGCLVGCTSTPSTSGGVGSRASYMFSKYGSSSPYTIIGMAVSVIGISYGCAYSAGLPTWISNGGSNTITHKTNIIGFNPSMIGTFCESTGTLADVYGLDYEPTLTRSCDAIVKVRTTNLLSPACVGIIVGPDTFAAVGDCLVVVDEDAYAIGDILAPSTTGLCRKASREEMLMMAMYAIPRPKVSALFADQEFVAVMLA
jgi:hypothetical protein